MLSMEGKVFFTVLVKQITHFFNNNSYIDTTCQKAGLPGFLACMEHASMIRKQIPGSKREMSDLHVVCVDSSVPHKVVKFALEFFNIPACIITIKSFSNLHMSFPMDGFSAGWHSGKLALQWAVHVTNPVCVGI